MKRSLYTHRFQPISPPRIAALARVAVAIALSFAFALAHPALTWADNSLGELAQAQNEANQRELGRMLERARENGWVMPTTSDLSRYSASTVAQALAMLQGDGDDCQKALRGALFLDAYRNPTIGELAVRDWDAGLTGDLFGIWIMKDETDVLKMLAESLAYAPVKIGVEAGTLARNMTLTYYAILNVNTQMALKNRAAWLEEIVALGLRKGWDAKTVALADQRIEARIWENINAFPKIDATLKEALRKAHDDVYKREVERAEETYKIAVHAAGYGFSPAKDVPGYIRYPYERALKAAKKKLEATESAARAKAAHDIGQALQNIAKARVQRDALHRYILPVSEGRCAEVHKEGPLPVAACSGGSCPAPAADPAFVPSEGGYWALVGSIGRVYENLNEHECYETRGTIGDGSASYSNAEVACSNRWGPITASYTWSSPPAALVPGQEYPISASISGSYIDGHGGAEMAIDMDVANTECGGRTGGHIAIIRPDGGGGGGLEPGWNREHEDAWSGTFTAPGESFGGSEGDNAPRFQIKATTHPIGCYRYIYEWRE